MHHPGFELITIKEVKSQYPFLTDREGFDYFEEWEEEDFFLIASESVNFEGNFYFDLYENREKKWLAGVLNLPLKEMEGLRIEES